MLALGLVVTVQGVGPALADVTSDRAAAIVHFPLVSVDSEAIADEAVYNDTVIQLSNTSNDPIDVTCFYENANAHCTNTGEVCEDGGDCCDGEFGCGLCLPGWNETDFHIRLTPRQPLGWLASKGLSQFPIDGLVRVGSDGSSNAGSRIPPVAEDPFRGMLKCIAVDETGAPVDRNVLKGEATLTLFNDVDGSLDEPQLVGSAKYNAVGIQAIEGQVNDDNTLVLGGEGAEYNGCPNVLILNHFFHDGDNPAVEGDDLDLDFDTSLVLVPCTQDLLRQVPGSAVVQFLVFNEFEQRFSTSRPIDCQFVSELEEIDTTQDERSIFNVAVSGTLSGQTRMTPIGSGLIGLAIEEYDLESSAFNIHLQGDRPDSDLIVLP
jgi:hypothetical protein